MITKRGRAHFGKRQKTRGPTAASPSDEAGTQGRPQGELEEIKRAEGSAKEGRGEPTRAQGMPKDSQKDGNGVQGCPMGCHRKGLEAQGKPKGGPGEPEEGARNAQSEVNGVRVGHKGQSSCGQGRPKTLQAWLSSSI